MQYGQPNGELTTGNICNSGENFPNVSHSQSTGQPVIKKKSAEYLFPKIVHASKSFFLVLGSISAAEEITNCMIQVRQMEDKMHLLFVVPLKNFLNSFEECIIGLSILSFILNTQESKSYSLILTRSYSRGKKKQM